MAKRIGVVVGRFAPFHIGHHDLVSRALSENDDVLVLVGCRRGPLTVDEPFGYDTVIEIARSAFSTDVQHRLTFVRLLDEDDDERWIRSLRTLAESLFPRADFTLYGHVKDASSYYLTMLGSFWPLVEVPMVHCGSATNIREDVYNESHTIPKRAYVDAVGRSFTSEMHALRVHAAFSTPEFLDGPFRWHRQAEEYRERWGDGPFVTCDSIVTTKRDGDGDEKVLLICRKGEPYRGYYALPGGFLEVDETISDGTLRELREETGIQPWMIERTRDVRLVSDDVDRDPRARIVSHCTWFELPNDFPLDLAQPADDASALIWLPLNLVLDGHFAPEMAFDHWKIVRRMHDVRAQV
jgi:bifunctional NMN adenylyltransferase/nudix hydrolase